jgi:hypothetical protein
MRAPDQTPNFDYSQAEWAEIEAAAQVIRKGPFPKKMRESLRAAACVYVSEMARAQDGQTARELKKRWQKIAGSSEKLHGDLSACMEDLLCEISRKGSRTADEKGMMTWLDAISFNLGLLPTIAERAALYFERHHDKSNPRLRFQSKILEMGKARWQAENFSASEDPRSSRATCALFLQCRAAGYGRSRSIARQPSRHCRTTENKNGRNRHLHRKTARPQHFCLV